MFGEGNKFTEPSLAVLFPFPHVTTCMRALALICAPLPVIIRFHELKLNSMFVICMNKVVKSIDNKDSCLLNNKSR